MASSVSYLDHCIESTSRVAGADFGCLRSVMGEGCKADLKDGADRKCTKNGEDFKLREIATGDEDERRQLVPQNGHKEEGDLPPKHVNLWEYNGGKISGASNKLVYTTKEEHKVPKEELTEEFTKLSQDFDRKMLQRQQKRLQTAAESRQNQH